MTDDGVIAPSPPRSALSLAERITVAQLLAQNHSVAEIAQALSRSPATIRAHAAEALAFLQGAALDFASDWVKASEIAAQRGDHRPAMQALEATKVIERPQATAPVVSVQIGFALPGVPAQPQALPPVIDLPKLDQS